MSLRAAPRPLQLARRVRDLMRREKLTAGQVAKRLLLSEGVVLRLLAMLKR